MLFRSGVTTSSGISSALSDETGSGALVFGTAPTLSDAVASSSFKIPNGSGATVDAAGKIAVDTTDDQLVYDGGAARVIPYRFRKGATIENLVAGDDNMLIWNAEKAITIQAASSKTSGFSGTQPTITLEDDSGNAMTGAPTCGTAGTWTNVTSANGLIAAEGLRIDTTNTPSPTYGTQALICFAYTEDAS